jgi:predicted HTH domain antitoxin
VTCPRLFGDLVTRGRILLAVERHKKGEASLGRAAELAGLPLGEMITILTEFGIEQARKG